MPGYNTSDQSTYLYKDLCACDRTVLIASPPPDRLHILAGTPATHKSYRNLPRNSTVLFTCITKTFIID